MQVAVSTTRPFHSAMLANALVKHGARVRIYSSAPRRYFRRLDASVHIALVPSLLQTAMHFMNLPASPKLLDADSWLYDHSVAAVIRPGDLFIGWATASLATARSAQHRSLVDAHSLWRRIQNATPSSPSVSSAVSPCAKAISTCWMRGSAS